MSKLPIIDFFYSLDRQRRLEIAVTGVTFHGKYHYLPMGFSFDVMQTLGAASDWHDPRVEDILTRGATDILDKIQKMNWNHNQFDYGMPALIDRCEFDASGSSLTLFPGRECRSLVNLVPTIYEELIRPFLPRKQWQIFEVKWAVQQNGKYGYDNWLTCMNCSKLVPNRLKRYVNRSSSSGWPLFL
jgi:hypothetical protein